MFPTTFQDMGSIEPPRRRAGRSQATAAVRPIEPMKRITKPGIRSCDLRCLLAVNRKYPDDESMGVSHETIYRSLFIQARGMLKKSCWTGPQQALALSHLSLPRSSTLLLPLTPLALRCRWRFIFPCRILYGSRIVCGVGCLGSGAGRAPGSPMERVYFSAA
jgi:hypothetical protein